MSELSAEENMTICVWETFHPSHEVEKKSICSSYLENIARI